MDIESLDWKDFRDLATPERAAAVMLRLYGRNAAAVAAEAARWARADDRDEDADFWDAARKTILAVLEQRKAGGTILRFPG